MKKKEILKYGSFIIYIFLIFFLVVSRINKKYPFLVFEETYKILNLFSENVLLNQYLILISFFILFLTLIIVFLIMDGQKNLVVPLSLFIISPTFVFYSINPTFEIISFFILVLVLLLAFKEKSILAFLTAVLAGLINGVFALLTALVFVAIAGSIHNITQKKILKNCFVITLISGVLFSPFNNTSFIVNRNVFQTLSSFIIELGNFYAVATIFILIAIFGLITFWIRKSSYEIYLSLLILSSILYGKLFFFSFGIILLSGKFINFFYSIDWEIKEFKIITEILIVFLILFSHFFFISSYVVEKPTLNEIELFYHLNYFQQGNIVTDHRQGYSIEYYTPHNTITKFDSYESRRVAELIFYSTNLDRTKELIREHDVDYIIISESMREEVWQSANRGLLIIIKDADTFRQILELEDYKIYEYIALD